jgi:hypothetical protein
MNPIGLLVGLLILVIGGALTVGVLAQSGTFGNSTTDIIPVEMPTEIAGFPSIAIGIVIALVGLGLIYWGITAF